MLDPLPSTLNSRALASDPVSHESHKSNHRARYTHGLQTENSSAYEEVSAGTGSIPVPSLNDGLVLLEVDVCYDQRVLLAKLC